jgi:toxin YoeB
VRLVFTSHGWEDYTNWQLTDLALVKRINRLLDDTLRDPTSGIGKPETLRYGIAGAWSRRITEEHRLVYQVLDEDLVVLQGPRGAFLDG